jgi:hypothetical protein
MPQIRLQHCEFFQLSSISIIMLSYKARAMGFAGNGSDGPTLKLLGKLHEALGNILDALKNYSGAFEAIGGMRGKANFFSACFLFLAAARMLITKSPQIKSSSP